ncbi:MAG: 4-hydroxythreonine-4-phosphate dehydrogenase [Ramlibacter sp.]|nr:4-hydroxythreonine-4-phosphate dehydrogenase [Ramlibacter sp.]
MNAEPSTFSRRPRLAVLLGDGGGVGPEMAVKLLARPANVAAADILLIGDAASLTAGESVAAAKLDVLPIDSIDGLRFEPGRVTHLVQPADCAAVPGQSTAAAGASALRALSAATDAAREGLVDGIVFAPLNKHSLRLGGMAHEDELRYMQERFGVDGFVCEFNITDRLWTSRVTSHVPLREVASLITPEAVRDAVHIIVGALRRAGIDRPRIAVSGLNPHAGDCGSIGHEEIEIIEPAVRRLQGEGIAATGPWSPDTVFIAARRGDFDAVVSMYHDQGQIAMKLMGFERGVTLHGGLPVPVATSASGSAFDIAGKGIAQIEGLQHAFDLCARMAGRST